ncbi:DUF5958 family protein [Streptomyces lydicus]|uniref:DUF5958 family protein n=1 Tax=Streptomyces lydicus TaxID=47763 RepID=UPI00244C064B|nr:DUF5958 family protein [Streptomyces lydicus]
MYEREVVVNELAQGLRSMAEGMEWFVGWPEAEQRLVVRERGLFCIQARATKDDAQEAIARSGLCPTAIAGGRAPGEADGSPGGAAPHAGNARHASVSRCGERVAP